MEPSRDRSGATLEQHELVSEHLTFAPLSIVDDITNHANDLLYKAVGLVEQVLDDLPEATLSSEERESGAMKLETLLENSIDRNFDAFELYLLGNVAWIPLDVLPWVRLGHHGDAAFSAALAGEGVELDEEIARTRKVYVASCRVKALLAREEAQLARKEASLTAHRQRLAFMHEAPVAQGVAPLQGSLDFIKDQTQALKQLLDETSALSDHVKVDLPATERGKYLQKVLLETIKDGGSFEKELAALGKVGSLEDMQAAAELLKQ